LKKIINKRLDKLKEIYIPSKDLGYYEIYSPETVFNLT